MFCMCCIIIFETELPLTLWYVLLSFEQYVFAVGAHKLELINERTTMGKWEEFSRNLVNFQEAQVDEDISVGYYYETHKLGLLNPDQSKTWLKLNKPVKFAPI